MSNQVQGENSNLPFNGLVLNDDDMYVIKGGVGSTGFLSNCSGLGCDCKCGCVKDCDCKEEVPTEDPTEEPTPTPDE